MTPAGHSRLGVLLGKDNPFDDAACLLVQLLDRFVPCLRVADQTFRQSHKLEQGNQRRQGNVLGSCKGAGYEPEPALESFTQKNIPSSTPAAADESVEDEQIGKRVDYASTLEQAYNNLENVLGKKGIDGLAKETKSLIGQQKNLMKTLDTMTPVLKNAQATIKSFDLESLTKNLGSLGNLMKQN